MCEHYEEGDNYREYVKFSCSDKTSKACSFCNEWSGPSIERCPKPYPGYSCLPEFHYLHYSETPKKNRDDFQPRTQSKKAHESGELTLSVSENVAAFADKFIVKTSLVVEYLRHIEVKEFKKKKRAEKAKEKPKIAKEKKCEDYDWMSLCGKGGELRKLRVSELNKYLKHQHIKEKKEAKIHAIMKHWSSQDQRTRQVQAEEVHRTSLSDSEAEHVSESESQFRDDTTNIILAVIGEEDESQTSNIPIAKTRSGRTITKRAEIDFSFFLIIHAEHWFICIFIVYRIY